MSVYFREFKNPDSKTQRKVPNAEVVGDLLPGDLVRRGKPLEQAEVIQIWNSFATTSESLNSRRHTTNTLFMLINTGLVGAMHEVWKKAGYTLDLKIEYLIAFLVFFSLGFLVNLVWLKLLKGYWIVSSSKIEIMRAMESRMHLRTYTTQYRLTEANEFEGFTDLEATLPTASLVLCTVAVMILVMLKIFFVYKHLFH